MFLLHMKIFHMAWIFIIPSNGFVSRVSFISFSSNDGLVIKSLRIRTIRTYIYNLMFVGEWFLQPRLKYIRKTIFEGLDHTKGLQ